MQIKELHLQTGDLPGTRKFYQEVLGLNLEKSSSTQLGFRLPGSLLAFHASVIKPQYHFAFSVPNNKVHEAADWLSDKAELIPLQDQQLVADFKSWNAEAVYFFDNNRNIVEFIGRRDLPDHSDKAFDSTSILSVNEVGIVTTNVNRTCSDLISQHDLHYFPKQAPLEDFAAVGDDDGLLIVVSDNRNWYPTQIPSSMHWYRLLARQNENEFILERAGH